MRRHFNTGSRGAVRLPAAAGMLVALAAGMIAGGLFYSWWLQPSDSPGVADLPEEPQTSVPSGRVVIGLEAQQAGGIRVGAAAVRAISTSLAVTGVVAPDQSRVAHLRPLARGVVEKVYVQLGDRISTGQPLVAYDNVDLGLAIGNYLSAFADLEQSLTDLAVKKTILARSRRMLEVGAIARTTFDIREAEYRDMQARVNSARAAVAKVEEQIHRFGLTDDDLAGIRAGRSEQEKLHRTESRNILRAPFSGVVTGYNVAEGELVEPSSELMKITDLSRVWVLADVYEKDLAAVRAGKPVAVRVAAYPDKVFRGRITYVGDVIEAETRTAKVRCVVPNEDGRLKLEMFATIEIPTEDVRRTLAVPSAAIQQVNGQPVVFVQRSKTEFEKRTVETGLQKGGWVEIRSGLRAGELVVTDGSFYLKSALLRELIGGEE